MSITLKSIGPSIESMFKKAIQDNLQASVLGLNRTAKTVQSAAVKSIAADLGVKQKDVRQAIKIKRATFSKPEAVVEAKGKRIAAIDLKPKPKKVTRPQRGPGVSFMFGKRRVLVPGAFIARVRGKLGVWQRKGKDRWPSRHIRGPSIGWWFARKHIQRALGAVMRDRFPKEVTQALNFLRRR